MSESTDENTQGAEAKGKGGGSGNKLLMIMALANFLGVFAVGGYLAYDKLIAGHASAQADKKAEKKDGHGEKTEEKAEAHGADGAEGGHGEKAEEGHGEKKAEGGHGETDEHMNPPDGPGPILALEPIVTNLGEPDTDRYLKVTVQLRITSEAARSEVEASLVPIRSQILMYFSSLNTADLTGPEKRRAMQSQVRRIANEAMPTSRIRFVYFTELVIQ